MLSIISLDRALLKIGLTLLRPILTCFEPEIDWSGVVSNTNSDVAEKYSSESSVLESLLLLAKLSLSGIRFLVNPTPRELKISLLLLSLPRLVLISKLLLLLT